MAKQPVKGPVNMYGNYVKVNTDFTGKYIVWSPQAIQPMQVVYNNRPDAIKVAYQMSAKFPKQQFIVCKAVGVAEAKVVEYKDLEDK